MRAKAALLLPLLLAALPASADDRDLDLRLPDAPMFSGAGAFGEGTYTGPRTETREYRDAHADGARFAGRGGCPTSPDGEDATVTGSVTTGIGYSSRGGNSNWNAADINLCKESVSASGNVNTANLNIRVGRYDGPGYPMGHYFDGPGMYGHPGLGFGPYDGGFGGFSGPRQDGSWTEGRRPWR
ncbi:MULTISPECIES: hypothetical protein [Luteimonas]|uniref:hypothetical protein n=1 Tax=Luteimonas TaxID=83614 RepID=UPI000C7DC143|nr:MULTISPECIES: hypothetical protein [Luteimonas]